MEQESKNREGKETEFQSPSVPILCPNNCGFFGSSATNNLCSKCYSDAFLSKKKASIEAIAVPSVAEAHLKAGRSGDDDVATKGGRLGEAGADEATAKKPANRCSFCNKKVGLMGFKCRCGDVFCSLHHYSDKHNCLFDYKGFGQDAIARSNPIVKADKMDKI